MARAVVALGLIQSFASANAEVSNECYFDPTIRIVIANTSFDVPIEYMGGVSEIGGKVYSLGRIARYGKCRGGLSGPFPKKIVSNRLVLYSLKAEKALDLGFPELRNTTIRLRATPKGFSIDQVPIEKFEARVERSGRELTSLPRFKGFIAFQQIEERAEFLGPFMSLPEKVSTPEGNPIVVDCGLAVNEDLHFGDRPSSCNVRYQWLPGVIVSYSFSTWKRSLRDFVQLDQALRSFLAQMKLPAEE